MGWRCRNNWTCLPLLWTRRHLFMVAEVAWSMTRMMAVDRWQFQLALINAPLMRDTRILPGLLLDLSIFLSHYQHPWWKQLVLWQTGHPKLSSNGETSQAWVPAGLGVVGTWPWRASEAGSANRSLSPGFTNVLSWFSFIVSQVLWWRMFVSRVGAFCLQTLRCLSVSPLWHKEPQLHGSSCYSSRLLWIQP